MNHQPAAGSRVMIALLIAMATLNPISINMIVPALTAMADGLDADFATIQLTLSSYLFATAISQLIHGPLSDKFGRRPVLLWGVLIYAVASLICLFAPSAWIVILGRILQGVGAAAGFALCRAIIRDLYERERAASMLGYITMGFSTAPMVAPLIGGLLSDYLGWRLIFLFMAVVGVVMLVVMWLALPETRKPMPEGQERVGFFKGFAVLARIPAFWAYALNTGLMAGIFFAFLGGAPFVATTHFGMSGTAYGVYFAMSPVAFFLGNFLTGRLTMRLGTGSMMRAGNALGLVAAICLIALLGSGWQNPLALFVPVWFIGLANGLSLSNSMAGAVSVRPALAGTAAGITGSFQVGFGAVATVVVGYLLTAANTPLPLPLFMTALGAAALATGIWARFAKS
jgi:DHA1 family bicyclomycin/chloramphenicol resistance-like MFS transporter